MKEPVNCTSIPVLACSATPGLELPSAYSYGYRPQSSPASSRACPAPSSGRLVQFAGLRQNNMSGIKTSGGFTLLEVLLAFVVFALSFTIVMEILSGSMRNTVRAREYTEAALVAQSVMDQLGLDLQVEQGAAYAGESGNYQWEVNIGLYEETSDSTNSVVLGELTGIELLQIDLVVSWGEPPRDKENHFSTVRAMLINRKLASG